MKGGGWRCERWWRGGGGWRCGGVERSKGGGGAWQWVGGGCSKFKDVNISTPYCLLLEETPVT